VAEKQQLNVYLPVSLIRRVKIAAIESGVSYSSYVERVLSEHLERRDAARTKRRR
jgi:predicted DNA binding CopG/RHH family protein